MKYIKLLVISILVLFITVSFLFALFPSTIRVSRVVNIQAPKEKVWAAVKDLSSWKSWNRFINDSTQTGMHISSPSFGENSFIRSDQFEVRVIHSAPDSLQTRWTKKGSRPFTGTFVVEEENPGSVIVQWYFDFHIRWYPWEKLGAMFYDKQIGPLMETSLMDLKEYLEKIP